MRESGMRDGGTRSARTASGGRCLRALAIAVALSSGAARADAQAASDSLVVSVLTMGPGREVFERFGHISIRLHDLSTGMDTAYNWGMFSFEQPRFLQRFLTGDTRYWMQGFPTAPLIELYRADGRWVVEQELALTRPQKDSLQRLIQWNAREENKWYRYDYYRDNCSTRVRDVLDQVLGGAIRGEVAAREHGVTYRSETLRLAAAYPLINFGMDFALGRPADDTISAWEEMFIPMRVSQLLRDVRIRRAGGGSDHLVMRERTLVADERYAERSVPPDMLWPALAAGLGVTAVVLVLSLLTGRSRAARGLIALIGTAWHLLAGVAGALVLCAGLFTRHAYMARNLNVLLATPASLALALLIPLAFIGARYGRAARAVRALGILAAACALAVVALRLVPGLSQENRPLLALAVPIQTALAFALWRATGSRDAS
ncbi:MAG: DUF4105 domain-containing protein [Gemmatimonadales bacterium]